MTAHQTSQLAAALTVATGCEWTSDDRHSAKRPAGEFIPPLSVARADEINGHAVYIADGWERGMFCGRLPGPYIGRGWAERAAADVAQWLNAEMPPSLGSRQLAAGLSTTTYATWLPSPIRLPYLNIATDPRTGDVVTLHSDTCAVTLIRPTGKRTALGEQRGPGMYERIGRMVRGLR